jgi:hypothetical protein
MRHLTPPNSFSLTHSHSTVSLRTVPANDEKHNLGRSGEHQEYIDVRERLRLFSNSPVNQTVGRWGASATGAHVSQAQSFNLVLNRATEPSGMLRRHDLVILCAPRQQCRDQRFQRCV